MSTLDCATDTAVRTRFSMSAIGSVCICVFLHETGLRTRRPDLCLSFGISPFAYQLDLVTPGRWPAWAASRTQMRQSPKSRRYARARPQRWQRFTCRVENFGLRFDLAICALVAICSFSSLLAERHAEQLKQG